MTALLISLLLSLTTPSTDTTTTASTDQSPATENIIIEDTIGN